MEEMPGGMDAQFQGEWAMYSCSMFAVALTNIARIYPEQKEASLGYVGKLIEIVMSSEIREYDRKDGGEKMLLRVLKAIIVMFLI